MSEQPSPGGSVPAANTARDTILALLAARKPEATVCPSEVARALVATGDVETDGAQWRGAMPKVHATIDAMVTDGTVSLSWKGTPLDIRAGPYRIGRGKNGT